jgi:hypothetical protein
VLGEDVWGDPATKKNTIQRTASNLRRKLSDALISELAIQGDQPGHYRLHLAS